MDKPKRLLRLVEGLQILMKYDTENAGLVAGDEQVWVSTAKRVAEVDSSRLRDLGWFEDEGSWSHYTM